MRVGGGRQSQRGLTRALACAASIASVCSCAASPDADPVATTQPLPVSSGSPFSGNTLPVGYYLDLSGDQQSLVGHAIDNLDRQCMENQGFEYLPYPPPEPRFGLELGPRYGLLRQEEAQASGYESTYQQGESPAYSEAAEAVDAERATQPGFDEALYGNDGSSTGCHGASRLTVYGTAALSQMDGYEELFAIQSASVDELYASPEGLRAVADWSACMMSSGYDFARWWDARESAIGSSPSEVTAQAVIDANCRVQTRLEARLFEAETHIQERMLEQSPGLVERVENAMGALLERAKQVSE